MKNKSLIIVVAMILIAVFAGSIFFDSFYEKTTPVSFYPPKRGGEDPVNNKEDINKPIIAEEKAEYISWGRNEPTEEDFIASFNEAIAKGEIVFDDFGGFGEFGKKVHSGNPQTTISTYPGVNRPVRTTAPRRQPQSAAHRIPNKTTPPARRVDP